MKNNEQIKADFTNIDNDSLKKGLYYLGLYEKSIQEYLVDVVAALCGIEKEKMLTDGNVLKSAHARWLYWYAYRYLSNESYDKIADITYGICGKRFTKQAIGHCISRMSIMVEEEPLWKKRWTIIKRIIKLRDVDNDKKVDNTITINIPKELREQITIKIQEK